MTIAEGLKPLLTDIKTIKTDPRNARKHPVKNLDAIKLSLETYGQRKPIVVNAQNDTIEAGNGLYMAAVALGWTQIAVVYVNDDEVTSKAYGLMDNQSALISEWDLPILKDLLTELDTGDLDMNVTGFSSEEIENLMTQFNINEIGFPTMPTGDKNGFQQMTFTLSNEQVEQVKQAIDKSKKVGAFIDTGNENSNGNALARICEIFNVQC
jgi:hypothetical protein